MQRRLDHFHAIQKTRKHLQEKVQERTIKSINEITSLDDKKDISNFSNSSNDDFQTFLQRLDIVVNFYTLCVIWSVVVNV